MAAEIFGKYLPNRSLNLQEKYGYKIGFGAIYNNLLYCGIISLNVKGDW